MKTRKTIPEISSNTINTGRLDQTKLYLFKIFSLPIWLVIISIILSFVTKPVRAGIEDIQPYYRYVPYEGPGTAAGQQRPKQPSGASEAEAKKGAQATSPGGQAPAASTQPSTAGQKESKAECEHEQKPSPVGKPERDTGEFPSGGIPSFCQADVNGDHYITKDELQNFPDLLKVFDKVDAGKDGRLEQHEYINLEMETSREGEVM